VRRGITNPRGRFLAANVGPYNEIHPSERREKTDQHVGELSMLWPLLLMVLISTRTVLCRQPPDEGAAAIGLF
jgi:hypothetical protein